MKRRFRFKCPVGLPECVQEECAHWTKYCTHPSWLQPKRPQPVKKLVPDQLEFGM